MPILHEDVDEVNDAKSPLLQQQQKQSHQKLNNNASFDYEDFIQKMKHPSCRPYLIQIRRFIADFENFSVAEQSTMFHRFHQRIWEKLLQSEAWLGASASEGVNAREGLEYLLMNQLYEKAYRNNCEDFQADREILLNIRAFSWLELSHLQSQFSEKIIVPSIYEFSELKQFRTPKDKLDALIRGCQKLKDLVGPEEDINADELLPILIVAIIKSKPEFLASELAYIQKFRDAQQLRSADAYLFTHCLATAQFIRNLNINELSFASPEDAAAKENLVKACIEKIRAEEKQKDPSASGYSRTPSIEFSRLEEKATKVFGVVRQSHAVRSIKKFFGEAEVAIRDGLESLDQALKSNSEDEDDSIAAEKRENELRIEEEFQMQLAMALSLSEQDLLAIPELPKKDFCESWVCTTDFV